MKLPQKSWFIFMNAANYLTGVHSIPKDRSINERDKDCLIAAKDYKVSNKDSSMYTSTKNHLGRIVSKENGLYFL